jgi:hypothetical protein
MRFRKHEGRQAVPKHRKLSALMFSSCVVIGRYAIEISAQTTRRRDAGALPGIKKAGSLRNRPCDFQIA